VNDVEVGGVGGEGGKENNGERGEGRGSTKITEQKSYFLNGNGKSGFFLPSSA